MDTVLKKSSKRKGTSIFYQAILILWLIIGSIVVYLKYNERHMSVSDWNNSIGLVNDIVASLYDECDTTELEFEALYETLYRNNTYEDVYITVRALEDFSIITTNDMDDSRYSTDGVDLDSVFCSRVLLGELASYGMRTYLGQQRAFRVSKYPDLGISVSTEVVLPVDMRSANAKNNDVFIILLVLAGVIITLFCVLFMLRYNNSMERLYLMLSKIYKNEDPSDLLKNFHWNKNVDFLANTIVNIYADKIKIIEEHYAEKEKTFEQEQHDMHAKRILTNNLRHELKTPIGIISGYIETIIEHPDLPQQLQNKFLNSCLKNVRRINNLVTSLSLLSRLEDGADAILYEDMNLYDTVGEIADEFTPKLREANMQFNLQIPEDTNVLSSNSSLYALFNNLIKNAINYSGGTDMGLTLLDEDEHFYKFSFWDNGSGVEPEYLEHLFEHFFRVEKNSTHATDGTGLGLPIVKLVVENHGGSILVRNRDKGGLEYIFTLPKTTNNVPDVPVKQNDGDEEDEEMMHD